MAKQTYDYSEIFGFDKLEKMIRQMDELFANLQQSSAAWLERLDAREKEVLETTKRLGAALRSIGLDDTKSLAKFQGIDQEVDKLGKRLAELQAVAAGLNTTIDANNVSIVTLKGTVKLLTAEYEKLDPQAKDFAANQKEIAQKVIAAKSAIQGQSAAIKGLKNTLDAADDSYNRLSRQTRDLFRDLKALSGAFDLNTGKLNKNNKAAVEMYNQIVKNQKVLKDIDAQLGVNSRKVGDYGAGWQNAKSDLLAFVGITTAVDTALRAIQKSFEVIATFDRFRTVIQFASKDTAEFSANLGFLEQLADRTGTDIETLYTQFGRFAVVGREANFTIEQTREIFASVVKAGGALKMSNEAVELSLKAIEQMMSKGKISSEELRQQLGDHLPGAMQLFAKGLGISVERLGDMMKNGEVLSAETLPKFAEQLNKTFGSESTKNVNTMTGSFNRLTNQVKLLIDELGRKAGVQNFFSTLNNGLATWFQNLRTAVNSNEWASFVAVLLGSPTENRRMTRTRLEQESKTRDDEQRRFTAQSYLSKLTPAQRELAIQRKQNEFASAAQAGAASQEKAREAQELLKVLNLYKEINKELSKKKTSDATSKETSRIKELNEEIKKTKTLLESSGKEFLKSSEGVALKAKYNALLAERKQLKVDAGTQQPSKIKEQRTELEKMLDELEKISKVLSDDVLSDLKGKKIVDLPKEQVQRWYELYNLLDAMSRQFGYDIPSSIEKTKQSFDRFLKKDAVSGLGDIQPLASTSTVSQLKYTGKGQIKPADTSKLPYLSDFNNILLRQETERLDLQRQFSSRLRSLKEEEKNELLRLLAEMQKAEREKDDEARKRAKEQFDYKIALARDEEKEKQRIREEYAQAVLGLTQATNDVFQNIQESKVSQLEKQRDYELKMVGDNEQQKTAITEKYARQITEIRRKQAIAEKAMAIFQIGVNTAMAIMKIWAEVPKADFGATTLVLSALAGITGALQAAAVLAKPLPAFKDGTMNAPKGMALVGEAGAELRESRGKYWLYDKPTITNLEAGDKIYTASQTTAMLAQAAVRQEELNRLEQNKALNNETSAKLQKASSTPVLSKEVITKGVAEGIKGMVVHQTSFDENGVRTWIVTQNSRVEQQKKRYKLNG